MKYLKYVSLFILFLSCKGNTEVNDEDLPVVRVYDNYLLTSELQALTPKGLSEVDSLTWVKDYIDNWVRKELILTKAEENLSDEDKNLDKQIEDYRSSLLIFKYEQALIKQKLDTIVSKSEIEEYYTQNSSNFILNQNIVKALYIKVPKSAPNLWKVRKWYRSDNEESIKELDAYCYQHAEQYDYFNEGWVEFNKIKEQLPKLYTSTNYLLKNRKSLELQDSTFYFFIRLYDYKLEGTVSPLELVRQNIKSIIINKRKIEFTNRLESEIYNDALNRGNFNIY